METADAATSEAKFAAIGEQGPNICKAHRHMARRYRYKGNRSSKNFYRGKIIRGEVGSNGRISGFESRSRLARGGRKREKEAESHPSGAREDVLRRCRNPFFSPFLRMGEAGSELPR